MFRRPIKEVNAEFIAEEKYLDSIQRTARESCIAAGMSRRETTAVLLAIEEGATNIIRHAYLYEKGTIRLRIVVYRKLLVFSLIDSGRSFRAEGAGQIDLQRLVASGRKGGLGFYMIQKIMDSVEYISAAGFNELRMIKRIKGVRTEGRPFLRRLLTLRMKFSVWTFLIMSVIIGVAFYYIDHRTSRYIYGHLDDTVNSLAQTVAAQTAGYILNRRSDVEFDELIVSYLQSNPELQLIVLTDSTGLILAHSEDIHNIRKHYRAPDFVDINLTRHVYRFPDDDRQRSYLITPIRSGDRQIGLVHITYSSSEIDDKLTRARLQIAVLILVLLVFGILGIYFLSNYFVRPIVKITRRVRRFASGDLETELPLEGAEEFFEISKAFNEIMTRLSRDRKNIIAREKMTREIEVASQIQKTLLPRQLPDVPGLQLDAYYRAAATVGGDLYDVFATDPRRYCIAVADVSGKGVPASLVMTMLRTVIQIQAANAVSARDILIKVNDYFKENIPPGMFITIMLAIYESSERRLNCVSAGHNPMLLYRAARDEVTAVNPAGMPLGMPVTLGSSFEERLEEDEFTLQDDDAFLIFTDGITETINREGQQYGLDRLTQLFIAEASHRHKITTISKAIVSRLDDFSGFVKPSDDLTFIVARAKTAKVSSGTRTAAPSATGIETRGVGSSHSKRRQSS